MKQIKLKIAPLQKTVLLLILLLGVIYLLYTWKQFKNDQADEVLQIARSIETTLPKENLKTLKGKPSDINTPEYKAIKNTLKAIISVNPKARFAYIYLRKNGKIYFIADSEPTESKDYSPPGQEYSEADLVYSLPFDNGKEFVTGSLTDRWGTWISVLIPIKDKVSGKTIAVFAMDFNAKSWDTILLIKIIQSSVLIVLLLLAFLFLFKIKAKNDMLKSDNTKHRHTENELRESEKKYRTIFENIQDVFYQTDLAGIILEISPSIEYFSEFTRDEIIGTPVNNLYSNPDDRNLLLDAIMKNGEVLDYELKLKTKTGKIKHASINARLIVDENGNPDHINGAIRDITERILSKTKLIESEYRLRTIIEAEPECIKIVDAEGRLLLMNPAGLAIIEADSMEQVAGQGIFSLITPEYRNAFIKMHKRVIAGESIQMEFELVGLKGGHNWLETSAVPLQYHGKVVYLAHTRKITERKRAEEMLKNSEMFLKETQTIARLGTYTINTKNDTWTSSDILDTIFGIDSYYDKTIPGWISIVHPEWKQIMHDYFINVVIGNEYKFDKEYKIIRNNDKEERWVHGLGVMLFNEENQPIKMIGTIQDITERKRNEEELTSAKEKAEESDRLKSAFLSNMSHEIRTPMNGILGFAELLKEPSLTGEEQQEYIGIIERSGTRMLNIINDIIDISKVESGSMKILISETNINQQIEYIYTFFKPEIDAKNMQFSFKNSLPSKLTLIKTDREKIYAILTNLVKNAIKFTHNGSIEFGYVLKPSKPRAAGISGYRFEPFELEFYVKDTGSGIRKEQLEIVFERFRQGSESLTRNYEGAGLGLSISKAFVEMLGGEIWVESEIGKGSIFYFTIPYNCEQEVKETVKIIDLVHADEKQIKSLKILIVEDDKISGKLLTQTIKKFSKEILRAKTGIAAVEICHNNPDIDLVLMDIQMPLMDGYEATKKIRKFNTAVIIIAQTAYAQTGDKEKAIIAGCNDYISKPVKKEELIAIMHQYFKKKGNE
ncbi:PAS domain S-box protein [Flavobacterium sp. LB3P122]|uniref:PAS domain S-box protein n=1 Tax=Flavobacterium algoriphilum TaxID=3398738 RepID=UPI003A86016D